MSKYKKIDIFDVMQIEELAKALRNANEEAENVAKAYSSDKISQLAFQIGYLEGYCKTASSILSDILKQK